MANIQVESPNLTYSDDYMEADYDYCTTSVEPVDGKYKVSLSPFSSFVIFLLEHNISPSSISPAKPPPLPVAFLSESCPVENAQNGTECRRLKSLPSTHSIF